MSGARAQEESLARSSALYACLEGNPMYALHERARDPLYTSYTIYSPDVPIFPNDEGELLEQPYSAAFISAPAVNAKVVLERSPTRQSDIRTAMAERVEKVLAITAGYGHEAIVLSAWGCGVFGNDPRMIARLFHQALNERFTALFDQVVFAIIDTSQDQHILGPFQQVFAEAAA